MNKLVYAVGPLSESSLEYFNIHDIKVVVGPKKIDYPTLKQLGNQITALIFPDIAFPNDLLSLLPHLKLISRCGVGVDNLPMAELNKRHIQVTNTSGVNANAVAELTVGLMIALSHKLVLANNSSREGIKELYQKKFTGFELKGKTIGLVGYGHIAQRVEEILNTFESDILIANHRPTNINFGCQVSFQTLIQNSDIISLHLPLNKETENLVNQSVFDQMNSNALLINTARGGLVDENALLHTLQTNRLGGAALDTTRNEPVNASNPLLRFKNVLITPHIGSQTEDTIKRTDQMVAKEIVHFLKEKEALHPVNLIV